MSIIELRQDSEEFTQLLQQATRTRVKNALVAAKAEVDREIVTLELKQKQADERKNNPKRYLVELHEYAWDQSDKFVKIFITLNDVQNATEDDVVVTFTSNSMKLIIHNVNNKDYGLTINNLLEPIDVEKSYRKIKTGMVAIYMKKQKEQTHWDQLTTIHKRLKEKRDDDFKPNNGNSEDVLMQMMKKMYQSGDAQTKQMIAKAWTQGQQKSHADVDIPLPL